MFLSQLENDTIMQKVMTKQDVEKYLFEGKSNQIGGCVTRASDSAPYIYNIETAYKDLRLDYKGNDNWLNALTNNDDLFVVRFTSDNTSGLTNKTIPLLDPTYGPPCTETGFVGGSRALIPEYQISGRIEMNEAAIFTIDSNGNERLYGYLNKGTWNFLD